MPILWPLKVPERGNAITQRKTLEIEHSCLFIHHTIWIYPFPHLILFNTPKKSLLKSSYPSQIFVPKKIPESKISNLKKSFDHPRHLKSRVTPWGRGTSREFVARLISSRPKKLAPLAKKLVKLDSAVVSMVFQVFSSSPCRSLLISSRSPLFAERFCRFLSSWSHVRKRTSFFFLFGGIHFQNPGKKTVSTILVDHDFCQIAWLAWFNSDMRIKYDRTCQRSIKIISIEKTFALHKSAQKKHFFLEFVLTESSWLALFNHFKILNFENDDFFTLDDTLIYGNYTYSQ